ncbi:MAG: hypothetical protein DRR19_11315 [Candidatus Parabeggiatoa sp. nov. 1]|nr:MAG: hypothetical protein DRR19_11315 [Gammaproteobacteria bacterium]
MGRGTKPTVHKATAIKNVGFANALPTRQLTEVASVFGAGVRFAVLVRVDFFWVMLFMLFFLKFSNVGWATALSLPTTLGL